MQRATVSGNYWLVFLSVFIFHLGVAEAEPLEGRLVLACEGNPAILRKPLEEAPPLNPPCRKGLAAEQDRTHGVLRDPLPIKASQPTFLRPGQSKAA